MKLFYKKFINEYERLICILGIKIFYSKSNDSTGKKIKYNVKIGEFSFVLHKRKKSRTKKENLAKLDSQKQMLTDIFVKCLRNFFKKNNDATTIVFGASTARGAFIEDKYSINFAIDGQDLYYTYQLFKKFCYQAPNLKNIVIYYDVFSSGNNLDVSPILPYISAYYKVFFDIPYKNKLCAIQKKLIVLENKLQKISKYINDKIDEIPEDIMPIVHGGLFTKEQLKEWADAEVKLSENNEMIKYLDILLKDSSEYNIFIVLAPRNPLVTNIYPDKKILFKNLFEVIKKHNNDKIKIIDCFDRLKETDFVDLLHINLQGAKKITNIINQEIKYKSWQ